MSDQPEKPVENHLYKICDSCEGEGQYKDYYGWGECHNCDGLGILLTAEGALIHEIAWRTFRDIRRAQARADADR